MASGRPTKPRVFVDADALFAGSAGGTQHGASLVVLRMAEITLIDAFASQQVIVEVERNLRAKLPSALRAFQLLVQRCLSVVPDPEPADLRPYVGRADPKDLPILVAALRESCTWLLTFNVRHFQPGHGDIRVLRPGEFVADVRSLLTTLESGSAAGGEDDA